MGFKDYLKAGAIITLGLVVVWFFMIRPHTFEWTEGGEASGTIKTLMSNSNVIGSPMIKAVVTLESGQQTIINVPLKSDVRSGDTIILRVQVDDNNPNRKRYFYARLS